MSFAIAPRRPDGFGAQLQFYVWNLMFAEDHGITLFLPNSFTFEHNYTNDAGFNSKLGNYMNLSKHYGVPSGVDASSLPTFNANYDVLEAQLDRLVDKEFFKNLRVKFMENKTDPFDPAYFNVAIHVRRPNSHDNRIDGADTPDAYYLNVMRLIREEHPVGEKPLRFHIYSQGDLSLFAPYVAPDVELHIDAPIEETMNSFLFADILGTCGSSFSYIAAFFTKGRVYYKPFWHKPLKSWRIMKE